MVCNLHSRKSYKIGRILLSKSMINVIIAVKHLTNKNRFLKISDSGPYLVGFPAMQIADLWTLLYHPANVLSPFFTLLFISRSACCAEAYVTTFISTDISSLVPEKIIVQDPSLFWIFEFWRTFCSSKLQNQVIKSKQIITESQ